MQRVHSLTLQAHRRLAHQMAPCGRGLRRITRPPPPPLPSWPGTLFPRPGPEQTVQQLRSLLLLVRSRARALMSLGRSLFLLSSRDNERPKQDRPEDGSGEPPAWLMLDTGD